jgi:hypothetical protein
MKKISKIAVIIIITFLSYNGFSQSINYKIHPTTKKITEFKHIFYYNKMKTYDVDFDNWVELGSLNFKVLLNINSDGIGRMVTEWDGDKTNLSILSCKQVKYNNSLHSYWLIKCKTVKGTIKNFYLEVNNVSNSFEEFWYKGEDNKRIYFDN